MLCSAPVHCQKSRHRQFRFKCRAQGHISGLGEVGIKPLTSESVDDHLYLD